MWKELMGMGSHRSTVKGAVDMIVKLLVFMYGQYPTPPASELPRPGKMTKEISC